MGHSRLGSLPKTRKWREVIGLIEHGASVAQVANAVMHAAEEGFIGASSDEGVTQSIWMLMQLPLASRSDDWTGALKKLGINVSSPPTLMDLVSKVTESLDARLANTGQRSDIGEMAQNALAETLSHKIGTHLPSLLSANSSDVQRVFSESHTVNNFSSLARDFFSRLSNHYLGYFTSKTLGNQVGDGRRFATLSQVDNFNKAMETHCHEAAKIVERFAGEWYSKTNYQQGGISKNETKKFTYGAMSKLIAELKEGAKESGQ